MKSTTCKHPACQHARHCNPRMHSPGGEARGTWPFRPGKTARDRARGHARRTTNEA